MCEPHVLFYFYFTFILVLLQLCGPLYAGENSTSAPWICDHDKRRYTNPHLLLPLPPRKFFCPAILPRTFPEFLPGQFPPKIPSLPPLIFAYRFASRPTKLHSLLLVILSYLVHFFAATYLLCPRTRNLEDAGSIPGRFTFMKRPWASCSHTRTSVIKQYNLLLGKKASDAL